MIQTELFNKNVEEYEAWYEKYPQVYNSELAAIKEHISGLPENIRGIEVGLGTGRFAQALDIKEGVEPSEEMIKKAVRRGVEVIKGVAERLPYADLQFDFVLFVTICHLKDLKMALKEAYRVLKPKGAVIIGFLDKDQIIAKEYKERGYRSTFYQNATFHSVKHIEELLMNTRFKNLEFNQTLYGQLDDIEELQQPKPGYGEGSFVVVKAIKK